MRNVNLRISICTFDKFRKLGIERVMPAQPIQHIFRVYVILDWQGARKNKTPLAGRVSGK